MNNLTFAGLNGTPYHLEIELQARPLETDHFDFLLSPLDKGQSSIVHNTASDNSHRIDKPQRTSLIQIGNNMMAYFNLKKFVQRLSRHRENYKKLNQRHLDLIGDKASDDQVVLSLNKHKPKLKIFDFQFLRKTTVFEEKLILIKKLFADIINKVPLVQPESINKLIWDYSMTVFRLLFLILIPLEIAFKPEIIFDKASFLTGIMLLLMVADALLRSSTIIYKEGKAIHDRWEILKARQYELAIVDGFAIIAFLINFGVQERLLLLLFFLQLSLVNEVLRKGNESSYFSKPVQGFINLTQFVLTLVSILHLFSCMWFAISINSGQPNWVQLMEIQDSPWHEQYMEAIYYATVTMLTIGYGDSVPINYTEKFISIIFILGTCLWFSYAVNTIGDIIQEISSNIAARRAKMRVINGFMNKRKIPYALKYKIREYLNNRWVQEEQSDLEMENLIINELSDELKKDLEGIGRKHFVEHCEFLRHFTDEFRQSLSSLVERVIIQPHNLYLNASLTLIEQGKLEYLNRHLAEGTFLPSREFLVNQPHAQYRAVGYVSLLIIRKANFTKLLRQYQRDHELFAQMKDKEIFEQNAILAECHLCDGQRHQTDQCPLMQYVVDREAVIKRHCFPTQAARRYKKRRRERSQFRALQDLELIQNYTEYFQNDKTQIIQEQLKLQLDTEPESQRKMGSNEQSPEEYQDFGPKRHSLFGNRQEHNNHQLNTRALTPTRPTNNHLQVQPLKSEQANSASNNQIIFLGIQKLKTTELDKSQQIKQKRSPQKIAIENQLSQNVKALYYQMQRDGGINKDLEILFLKQTTVEVKDFDQVHSYQLYYPNHNISEVLKKDKPVYKLNLTNYLRYMFYPFLYVLKFNKPQQKKKITVQFNSAKNIVKFKNALLNKRINKSQVSPQI